MKNLNRCPICLSIKKSTIFQSKRRDDRKFRYFNDFLKLNEVVKNSVDKNYSFVLDQCLACKHIYQPTVFCINEEKEFHEKLFDNCFVAMFNDYFENAEIILKELKTIFFIYKYNSILDVGAAFGEFCHIAKALNLNPYAFEICKKATKHLENSSLPFYNHIDSIDKKFDLIRLSHVLSHLHNNHEQFILKLISLLNKDAIIYIVDHDAEKIELNPYFFKPFWHVNIFSKKSISILFEKFESLIEIEDLPAVHDKFIFKAFRKI